MHEPPLITTCDVSLSRLLFFFFGRISHLQTAVRLLARHLQQVDVKLQVLRVLEEKKVELDITTYLKQFTILEIINLFIF